MPATLESLPLTNPAASPRPIVTAGTCPLCGSPLENPAACSRCDWVQGYGHVHLKSRQSPRDTVAALLTLLWPGTGQLYKGHLVLGGVLAVIAFAFLLWSLVFIMFFGPLILPVYWAGVAADAFFRKDLKAPGALPAGSPPLAVSAK